MLLASWETEHFQKSLKFSGMSRNDCFTQVCPEMTVSLRYVQKWLFHSSMSRKDFHSGMSRNDCFIHACPEMTFHSGMSRKKLFHSGMSRNDCFTQAFPEMSGTVGHMSVIFKKCLKYGGWYFPVCLNARQSEKLGDCFSCLLEAILENYLTIAHTAWRCQNKSEWIT